MLVKSNLACVTMKEQIEGGATVLLPYSIAVMAS